MVRDRRLFTHLNLKHLILLIGYIYLILIVRLISAFYRFDQLRSRRSIFFCGWSKCDGGFLISAKGSIQWSKILLQRESMQNVYATWISILLSLFFCCFFLPRLFVLYNWAMPITAKLVMSTFLFLLFFLFFLEIYIYKYQKNPTISSSFNFFSFVLYYLSSIFNHI